MIAAPHNDRTCLDAITEHLAARVRARDPEIARVAEAHADTRALADWIRSLPQRDDDGLPDDGPKVDACEPAQRLRVPARDPNCVERAALYLAAAELIDDGPVRQLATARTPGGLHTFPIEDGEPVVLDPDVSRNALAGGLFRSQALRNSETLALAPEDLIDWLADLAAEPAAGFAHGAARVERGHRALRGVLAGRPLCVADVRDVAFLLALARREARLWGPVAPGWWRPRSTPSTASTRPPPRAGRPASARPPVATRPSWRSATCACARTASCWRRWGASAAASAPAPRSRPSGSSWRRWAWRPSS